MHLNLFGIGSFTLNFLSLFLGLSVFLSSFLFWRRARFLGFSEKKILDFLLIVLISALIGGRILHLYLNKLPFTLNNLLFGSVSVLGALFAGAAVSYFYVKKQNWSIYTIGDIAVIPVLLGQLVSSIGKYVMLRDSRTLVESVFFLLVLIGIAAARKRKFFSGFLFFSYIVIFSLIRIISALVTGDRRFSLLGIYSLLIILAVLAFWRRLRRLRFEFLLVGAKQLIPMVSRDFIEKIKKLLRKKKERLAQERLQLENEDPYADPTRVDHNADLSDDAQEDEEHEDIASQKRNVIESENLVDRAIEAINKGTYGICSNCNKEISEERLKAYPEATTCLNCKKDTSHT